MKTVWVVVHECVEAYNSGLDIVRVFNDEEKAKEFAKNNDNYNDIFHVEELVIFNPEGEL